MTRLGLSREEQRLMDSYAARATAIAAAHSLAKLCADAKADAANIAFAVERGDDAYGRLVGLCRLLNSAINTANAAKAAMLADREPQREFTP